MAVLSPLTGEEIRLIFKTLKNFKDLTDPKIYEQFVNSVKNVVKNPGGLIVDFQILIDALLPDVKYQTVTQQATDVGTDTRTRNRVRVDCILKDHSPCAWMGFPASCEIASEMERLAAKLKNFRTKMRKRLKTSQIPAFELWEAQMEAAIELSEEVTEAERVCFNPLKVKKCRTARPAMVEKCIAKVPWGDR